MTKNDFISSRKKIAKDYFLQGFNCAQSVALAFYDLCDIDKEMMSKLSSPFGGGMGQMREVCGAVSGMLIIEGIISGYSSPTDKEDKKRVYEETKSLGEKFKEINGSIICRELLSSVPHSTDGTPAERNQEYYKKRPCAELVENAAEILAEKLFEVIQKN
ncbi:MAG: C_GCAxxG_C_C family protein [Ruminococcaceae bacterium]|nr:C_GCAxxG_C_C family protein [Oscillospiraceae bacterium]